MSEAVMRRSSLLVWPANHSDAGSASSSHGVRSVASRARSANVRKKGEPTHTLGEAHDRRLHTPSAQKRLGFLSPATVVLHVREGVLCVDKVVARIHAARLELGPPHLQVAHWAHTRARDKRV